ncbi:hypothetical protein ACSBR1_020414 [Camellia fascicularis]
MMFLRQTDSRSKPGHTTVQKIKHFSHKHSLIFSEEHLSDGKEVSCNGCQQPISGPCYGCVFCYFFLHKLCAELPMKMSHHMHTQHPLDLVIANPKDGTIYNCAACGRKCEAFLYKCSKCFFCLDIMCVSAMDKIQQVVRHDAHQHPLISIQRPALFFCFACGREHRGASYLCTTCGFWINQKCASLPSSIKCINHHHPLSLIYCLPDEYYQFRPNCEICTKYLNRRYWAYICVGCRYFSHVNCATSRAELSRNCETEVGVKPLDFNMKGLPLADESVDPITLFIRNIGQPGKYNKAAEINHSSHVHPLVFVDKPINNKSSLDSKDEVKHDEICDGCAKPILAPFYHCVQCNFFLHECCAELHSELQNPCHPEHLLQLIPQQTPVLNCAYCLKSCNVFMFGCETCKFYLDIRCASLPHFMRHDTHKRTLALRKVSNGICSACKANVYFVFACEACSFNLCHLCALSPLKFRHRYDKHPFLLTYSPIESHLDEYYCEICENEVNPKCWFYHCIDCDQSLHTGCVHPLLSDLYSNVKFGGTLKVEKHPHFLTFVQCPKTWKNPRGPCCDCCGKPLDHDRFAFECVPCNFRLRYRCAFDAKDSEK